MSVEGNVASAWMEFLQVSTARPLACVDHKFFGQWPCITENAYGKGHLIYSGTVPDDEMLAKLILRAVERKGIAVEERSETFPIIFRSGTNDSGKTIRYVFNYSSEAREIDYPFPGGKSLLGSGRIKQHSKINIEPWGVVIVEE